jgi:hypothetical protein
MHPTIPGRHALSGATDEQNRAVHLLNKATPLSPNPYLGHTVNGLSAHQSARAWGEAPGPGGRSLRRLKLLIGRHVAGGLARHAACPPTGRSAPRRARRQPLCDEALDALEHALPVRLRPARRRSPGRRFRCRHGHAKTAPSSRRTRLLSSKNATIPPRTKCSSEPDDSPVSPCQWRVTLRLSSSGAAKPSARQFYRRQFAATSV